MASAHLRSCPRHKRPLPCPPCTALAKAATRQRRHKLAAKVKAFVEKTYKGRWTKQELDEKSPTVRRREIIAAILAANPTNDMLEKVIEVFETTREGFVDHVTFKTLANMEAIEAVRM